MRFCFGLFIAFLLFISCENVTFSPLVGKWQLKSVEKNGELVTVDTVWYNFQSKSIFGLQIYFPQDDKYSLYIGMRTQKDNVVSIDMDDETIVYYFDWSSDKRSFTIEKSNRRRLELRSEEGYLYSFTKF